MVVLRADEATVEEHKASMAQEVGLMPSSCNGQPWSWRAVLSANQISRIRKVCGALLVSSNGVFLSLAQDISHQPSILSRCIPTLIRNSLIYFLEQCAILDASSRFPEVMVEQTHFEINGGSTKDHHSMKALDVRH